MKTSSQLTVADTLNGSKSLKTICRVNANKQLERQEESKHTKIDGELDQQQPDTKRQMLGGEAQTLCAHRCGPPYGSADQSHTEESGDRSVCERANNTLSHPFV